MTTKIELVWRFLGYVRDRILYPILVGIQSKSNSRRTDSASNSRYRVALANIIKSNQSEYYIVYVKSLSLVYCLSPIHQPILHVILILIRYTFTLQSKTRIVIHFLVIHFLAQHNLSTDRLYQLRHFNITTTITTIFTTKII